MNTKSREIVLGACAFFLSTDLGSILAITYGPLNPTRSDPLNAVKNKP